MQTQIHPPNTMQSPLASPSIIRRPRPGFTVIEMLVVLALSSMLLIGLMSIVNLFGTYQAVLVNEFPETTWQSRLSQQIRTDIINSREYRVSPGKLELIGYASKNFLSGESELLPSNITYQAAGAEGGDPCLFRSESHYTPTGQVVWRSELMALGYAGIQFERTQDWDAIGSQPQVPNKSTSSQTYSRISDRMTLVFHAAENASQLQDWVIPVTLR